MQHGERQIDVETDELVTLAYAAKTFPELRRNGRQLSRASIWRWVVSGQLKVVKVGGVMLTTRWAIRERICAENPLMPAVSRRERQRQVKAARDKAIKAGA